MNRYLLAKAGIDANDGIRRFSNNKEAYEHYLMEFPEDTLYPELLNALKEKNVKAAFFAAHSLKGVSGNLSMVRLHERLMPLVEELRRDNLDHAQEYLAPVQEAYDQVIEALKKSQ